MLLLKTKQTSNHFIILEKKYSIKTKRFEMASLLKTNYQVRDPISQSRTLKIPTAINRHTTKKQVSTNAS